MRATLAGSESKGPACSICTQRPSSSVMNSAAEQSSFFFFAAVSFAQARSFSVTKSGRRITEIQRKAALFP